MPQDYRDYTIGDKQPEHNKRTMGLRRWWFAESEDPVNLADEVYASYETLVKRQGGRIRQAAVSARLYSNVPLWGGGLFGGMQPLVGRGTLNERVNFNVIQSVIDAVHSKMMKNEPWPFFLTSGGDFQAQAKAKRLNKFIDGLFLKNRIYELATEVFRDAEIWGTGIIHAHIRGGQPVFERVLPFEIVTDDVEAFYGEPRQLYRSRSIDRQVLAEAVRSWHSDDPKRAEELAEFVLKSPPTSNERTALMSSESTTADVLEVVEAWHLPDGPDASAEDSKGGRHSIVIQGMALLDEPYTRERFPFTFFHWTKRPFGFWGQGLAEQLAGIQIELNKVMWMIQRSIQLGGMFKIWIGDASGVSDEHINGTIGAILRGGTVPPQYITPDPISQELLAYRDRLIQNAYEQAGITQMSAQGVKPEGLDSGVALREYNNIESDRFLKVGRAYENMFLDLTQLTVGLCEEAAEVKNFRVMVPFHGRLQEFDWKQVALDDAAYVMQVWPVSRLPEEPAGRLQTITEMAQAGMISQDTSRRLLGYPDLESVMNLQDSQIEVITKVLDAIVEENSFTPPSQYDDLATAKSMALQYYARGRVDGLEPAKLASLSQWIVQVDQLQKIAQQQALGQQLAQQQQIQAAQPQAVPQPRPQSDMLPNTPQG